MATWDRDTEMRQGSSWRRESGQACRSSIPKVLCTYIVECMGLRISMVGITTTTMNWESIPP